MMKHFLRNSLYKIFCVIFLLSFIWTFYNILFKADDPKLKPGVIIICSAIFIIVLFLLFMGVKKIDVSKLERHRFLLLGLFFILLFAIQIIFDTQLKINPVWDFEAFFRGGESVAINGSLHSGYTAGTIQSYSDYFSMFPFNLGIVVFLAVFFKLSSVFGAADYYFIATIVNILIMDGAILLVYLICKKQFDIRIAFFALILCALCSVFYTYPSFFYTDSLSMLFPPLVYYLYLIARKKEKRSQYCYYAIIGILCAIGFLIKSTVVIMGIAIMIDLLLTTKYYGKTFLRMVSTVAGFAIIVLSFNLYIYSFLLDRDHVDKLAIPYTHFIMMGMKGNGGYNPEDYEYTKSQPNLQAKDRACKKEIADRFNALKLNGIFKLYTNKAASTFGNGTYDICGYHHVESENEGIIRELVASNGKYNDGFTIYSQAVHVSIFILITLMAFLSLFKKKRFHMSLLLSVFGVFVFFLLWETKARIIVNYIPIFIVSAVYGMVLLSERFRKIRLYVKEKIN